MGVGMLVRAVGMIFRSDLVILASMTSAGTLPGERDERREDPSYALPCLVPTAYSTEPAAGAHLTGATATTESLQHHQLHHTSTACPPACLPTQCQPYNQPFPPARSHVLCCAVRHPTASSSPLRAAAVLHHHRRSAAARLHSTPNCARLH